MRPANISFALAALCSVAACTRTPSSRPPSGPAGGASFKTTPCPQPNIAGFPDLDFPSGVQCGYLTVLENRAKPDGRHIRIFVMRAPAVSATPKPDPIVYLSGGPGGAGSFEVAFMIKHGLNADREVIFVDQRGTHRADPLLACPEWEQVLYDSVSVPFAAESATARDSAAIRGVPRPAGRDGRRPRGLQQYGERRRHRRPPGGAGHRYLERLRGLLRIEAGVDRPARSPTGHPQRDSRLGVTRHEQHRREVVVGSGQFVQGDLRCVCCPAGLRRSLPEPGSGLHGHGEPPRHDARDRSESRTHPAPW